MITLDQMMTVRKAADLQVRQRAHVIRQAVGAVRLCQVISLFYVAFAISLFVSPNEPLLVWLRDMHGLNAVYLAYLFLLAALVMIDEPPLPVFALCLTPLLVYGAVLTWYLSTLSSYAPAATFFIGGQAAFLLLLYAKRIGPIRLEHVWSGTMLLLGGSFIASPSGPTKAFLEAHYGLTALILGLLFIGGGLSIAVLSKLRRGGVAWANKGTHTAILIASMLFVLYNGAGLLVSLVGSPLPILTLQVTPNLLSACVNSLMLFIVFWGAWKLTSYWPADDIH